MKALALSLLLVAPALADEKKVSMPDEWSRCSKDAECTFVSLGCCDTTPVNRTYATQAQKRLDESGRPYCAVKAACGEGLDGTWAKTAGRCVNRRCAPPKW